MKRIKKGEPADYKGYKKELTARVKTHLTRVNKSIKAYSKILKKKSRKPRKKTLKKKSVKKSRKPRKKKSVKKSRKPRKKTLKKSVKPRKKKSVKKSRKPRKKKSVKKSRKPRKKKSVKKSRKKMKMCGCGLDVHFRMEGGKKDTLNPFQKYLIETWVGDVINKAIQSKNPKAHLMKVQLFRNKDWEVLIKKTKEHRGQKYQGFNEIMKRKRISGRFMRTIIGEYIKKGMEQPDGWAILKLNEKLFELMKRKSDIDNLSKGFSELSLPDYESSIKPYLQKEEEILGLMKKLNFKP
jgi:hypothetical protein